MKTLIVNKNDEAQYSELIEKFRSHGWIIRIR